MQHQHSDSKGADYIDVDEVALLTGMSRSWLQHVRPIGEGPPFYRMGKKRILYRRDEVENWVASRQVSTAPSRKNEKSNDPAAAP
jgi:predicted DNA-binding transcriptional regulator AlpA